MSEKLIKYSEMNNIAEEGKLSDEKLLEIGHKVMSGFDDDLASSQEWLQDVERIVNISSLKAQKKSYPLPNSANIKFPIITKACYEFASRTYPEIVKDQKVVKARVIGLDPYGEKAKQAQRVSDYMNYQLLMENVDWELELDRLLHLLALVGFVCKKTYYDPVKEVIKSEICDYNDLIINSDIKSLEDAQRISHILHVTLNDLIESSRSGIFLSEPVEELLNQYAEDTKTHPIDIIEQHCYLDLDNDRYSEPYIVTVVKETGKVLRVVARYSEEDIVLNDKKEVKYITPQQFFTDYHFLVSPKGKFQSVGFGILTLHLNETINTLLNQIVDSGQLANLRGGYIDSQFKVVESGNSLHNPGEFKKVKVSPDKSLKDGVYPITYAEPSNVLYQLVGLLIEASKDLTSSTEVLAGASSPENSKSGATMALIEQGLKVFTAIQKRIYRSLSSEYKKLFNLDGRYLDPEVYVNILDDMLAVHQQDFDTSTVNIMPVADPNLSSEAQRSQKNQILLAVSQLPGIDPIQASYRILQNSDIDNPDELKLPPEALNAPNPEIIKVQAEIERAAQDLNIRGRQVELDEKKFLLEVALAEIEIMKMKSEAIKNIAQAEAAEIGTQLQDYQLQLDMLTTKLDQINQTDEKMFRQQEIENERQSINSAMAQQSANKTPTSGTTS